jgi:hypothetical protein
MSRSVKRKAGYAPNANFIIELGGARVVSKHVDAQGNRKARVAFDISKAGMMAKQWGLHFENREGNRLDWQCFICGKMGTLLACDPKKHEEYYDYLEDPETIFPESFEEFREEWLQRHNFKSNKHERTPREGKR